MKYGACALALTISCLCGFASLSDYNQVSGPLPQRGTTDESVHERAAKYLGEPDLLIPEKMPVVVAFNPELPASSPTPAPSNCFCGNASKLQRSCTRQ